MKKISLVLLVFLLIVMCTQKPSIDYDSIMATLALNANGKTEVVKEFPDSFPQVLIDRGRPLVYTKENSNNFEYIGMPVGGIGAGQLYLGGDGQLWFWDIFSLNHNHGQFKGEEAYEFPYQRSKPNEYGARTIEQGFSITAKFGGTEITKQLNRDGFSDIKFKGQYPIGYVIYQDDEMPVKVEMQAYSPFIPLDLDNSILPATVFDFLITNNSKQTIEVNLNAWLENAVLVGTREFNSNLKGELVNVISELNENGMRLDCSVTGIDNKTSNNLDHGSMALALVGNDGHPSVGSNVKESIELSDSTKLVGKLSQCMSLAPNKTLNVSAILTWYFPKTYATQNKWKKSPEDIGHPGADTTRYYARLFQDAGDVSDYIINNYEMLSGSTKLWHQTWYNSTLPYWFLDRIFLNTSILASSTVSLVGDKLYYGTEGGNQGPGTCTHVYGYTQAPGRLFPELEKSIREQVDYVPVNQGGALTPEGVVKFRWFNHGLAVDGQSGIILKSYQLHLMSSNHTFLQENYQAIKKIMQGLTEHNDSDYDGILTGPQHNTLDADWYGKVTWLSLYYTVALRAMSEMAFEVGDNDYADFCLQTADKGRRYIEHYLFNGEYFIHEVDSLHPESPGTYNGLEYSQLLGQSWAYQVGLGEIVDPQKAKTALESMWRYNFSTDVESFRKANPEGRWYAMPGEGGLIACTWPRGGKEVLEKGNPRFAAYNNECQNGYEYTATSLMMWQDMPYHSLAHIWYMHNNRYYGSKRNPWCEIEWGIHYARSMASYGHLIAISGFEYHGPKGYMAFSPKITPWNFKSAFTAAEGWGTFEQIQRKQRQTNRISIAYGLLKLNILSLAIDPKLKFRNLYVNVDDKSVEFKYNQVKGKLNIEFNDTIVLNSEEPLTVLIK